MKRQHYTYILAALVAGLIVVMAMPRKEAVEPFDAAAMQRVMGGMAGRFDAWLAARQRDSLANKLDSISGHLTFADGTAAKGVVVSDGTSCTRTDSTGRYALLRDKKARFVFYTVPSDCEVPVHSDSDRTAFFYQPVTRRRATYDFRLTRLPGGTERNYRMIVIGDPQVTNAMNPFYTGPNDNLVEKSDVARFNDETMTDIRRTIAALPAATPVYGLSMGDNVQYYGGYNSELQQQIRAALGSSRMRLFSVIGNHDQDGSALYRSKWEQCWGPTDYSFNRGNEHYVCLNNVQFTRHKSYYSPGELTDRQMKWLRQDLALTPRHMRVVLCYHIPLTFGTAPGAKASPLGIASEEGHYYSSRLPELLKLLNQYEGGYELFCGHTHFAMHHEIEVNGERVVEHCHAAACGNIWQSNINICGTPNGYYVYTFDDERLADCYYKGTFWPVTRQMTLFRAATDFNGESYANDWNLPHNTGLIVANVFNADSRWDITVVENGLEHPMHRISSCGQDAFATGYHHKYCQAMPYRFVSKQNGYLVMNHLFYYEPHNRDSRLTVRARDPYGHIYECNTTEVVTVPFYNFAHYYRR